MRELVKLEVMMIASILMVSALISSASAQQGAITQEILACERNRIAHPETCPSETQAHDQLALACVDPVKYVCTKAPPRGRMLNSRCKINLNENSDAAQTPEVIGVTQKIKKDTDLFLQQHASECPAPGPECTSFLKTTYAAKLKKIQLDAAYTPARIARMNKIFKEVQDTARSAIQESTRFSSQDKAILIKRIDDTSLLDPFQDTPDSCYFMGDGEAETSIYNIPDQSGHGPSKVRFCLGAMTMIDREEESSLIWTLGHELTHSFDPCVMDMLQDARPPLPSGDHFYQATTKCLRGGTGADGCSGGVLHCNDASNTKAYCVDEAHASNGAAFDRCMAMTQRQHNCSFTGPENDTGDLSTFRAGPGKVDQTQESFADFMGAEIYGKILKKRDRQERITDLEKLDQLVGLSADFASLHGVCLNENTNDVHPPGRMRVNNNVLGNTDFADVFCKGSTQRQCESI